MNDNIVRMPQQKKLLDLIDDLKRMAENGEIDDLCIGAKLKKENGFLTGWHNMTYTERKVAVSFQEMDIVAQMIEENYID